MLEHPDITRVNLTGYARLQTQPSRIERCPYCHEEFEGLSDTITYADRYFCEELCLMSWITQKEWRCTVE